MGASSLSLVQNVTGLTISTLYLGGCSEMVFWLSGRSKMWSPDPTTGLNWYAQSQNVEKCETDNSKTIVALLRTNKEKISVNKLNYLLYAFKIDLCDIVARFYQ
ncbi:hypothetical protein WN943_028902 [Citrus x changshan-huyou]